MPLWPFLLHLQRSSSGESYHNHSPPWLHMRSFLVQLHLDGSFFSFRSSNLFAVCFLRFMFFLIKILTKADCFKLQLVEDDHIATSSVFGYLMLTTGIGNILSTPIATSLQKSSYALHGSHKLGFDVNDGRYASMIIFTGVCFATAAASSCAGWWSKNSRS
jgi:hypothetical protein